MLVVPIQKNIMAVNHMLQLHQRVQKKFILGTESAREEDTHGVVAVEKNSILISIINLYNFIKSACVL